MTLVDGKSLRAHVPKDQRPEAAAIAFEPLHRFEASATRSRYMTRNLNLTATRRRQESMPELRRLRPNGPVSSNYY